jgi:hypothetical protein
MAALSAEAEGMRGRPGGVLRIDMPITVGTTALVPRLAQLASGHPALRFDLSFSDRHVDVVKEGFDAVLRIGALSDSSRVARRIGEQAPLPISLVYPCGSMVTPRLRVLIDAFTAVPVRALPEFPGRPAKSQRPTPARWRR